MILYFSATGNNKHIAESIAKATDDKAISIESCDASELILEENENLGIVSPTYFFMLPPIMADFIEKLVLNISSDNYVFGIVTYGSTSGSCGGHLKKGLSDKDIHIDALYSIITPDTWTVQYDLSDPKKVRKTLSKTEEQLVEVTEKIKHRSKGDFRDRRLPYFIMPIWKHFYENARKTSHFHVEEECIGCGLCAKNCPCQAIELRDGKPIWEKEKCYVCFRCLHKCPKFAIQYEDKTKKNGQYRYEMYGKL